MSATRRPVVTKRQFPTRLVLLGHPVSHSLSPVFQQAALGAAGLPQRYELLDVPPGELTQAIEHLRREGAAGNVTIPHKEHVFALCDEHTQLAERVRSVNTFWFDGAGRLVGDNTDVAGFEALTDLAGVERAGCVVACLGSGGAAAAVCAAVASWPGARVQLTGRSPARGLLLAERFAGRVQLAHTPDEAVACARLVVNATPLGLRDTDPFPVEVEALARDAYVMDLVYRPGETRWVLAARRAGHRAVDGAEMLLRQGAAAFERWFGRPPDVETMRTALRVATMH